MIVEKVTIINKLGLHARAASKFVSTAQEFASDVTVKNGDRQANGKSIMAIMMLQCTPGTELELRIDGEDEQKACEAIVELVENRFGEDE